MSINILPEFLPDATEISAQLSRIKASAAIGRSARYYQLLDYLVNDTLENLIQVQSHGQSNVTPKEIDIAINVFDKDSNFDHSDASVRVYISKLRKKLEIYYQTEGQDEPFVIHIPTGSYRLAFEQRNTSKELPVSKKKNNVIDKHLPQVTTKKLNRFSVTISLLILVIVLLTIIIFWQFNYYTSDDNAPNPPYLWQDLNNNGKPTLIVLGDRYVFLERDTVANHNRRILDLRIHNSHDFQQYLKKFPERFPISQETKGRFLEQSSAFALQDIIPLFDNKQQFSFRLSSELNATDMKNYNIVYIGGYKSLGKLNSFFQASNFEVTNYGKLLIDKASKQEYFSGGSQRLQYTDHGLFTKYSGPNNNTFYLIVGYSDSAVLHIAKYLTNRQYINDIPLENYTKEGKAPNNFELIYKVDSLEYTDIMAQLLYHGDVDVDKIWQKTP
jgi:hypothetical protein